MQLTVVPYPGSLTQYRNADYVDESGKTLYKVKTSRLGRKTTIQRVNQGDGDFDYELLATIAWKLGPGSADITLQGKKLVTKETFRRDPKWYKERQRDWTAPDGTICVWLANGPTVKLKKKGDEEAKIARFHQRKLGLFGGKKEAAYLEIMEGYEGSEMVDAIMVSFIFMERFRREKEAGG